jgi:hypothetical protein
MVEKEFKEPEPEWTTLQPEEVENDIKYLYKECDVPSEFDPNNNRNQMLHSHHSKMIIKRCQFGQVIAIGTEQDVEENIPWGLWGRILRRYSDLHKIPFKVFLLATHTLRTFPKHINHVIKPENINGGYTYSCNRETIIIYRAEDATRVLLHELMHSCCMDNHKLGIDRVEAETEAWAELLYVAFLSRGILTVFNRLLRKQCEWIIIQNTKVKKHMKHPTDFPYRYTVCKELVWRRWGIINKKIDSKISAMEDTFGNSLRLTYPPDRSLKRIFNVSNTSTIL